MLSVTLLAKYCAHSLPSLAFGLVQSANLGAFELAISGFRFTLPRLATYSYFEQRAIRKREICLGALLAYTWEELLLEGFDKFHIGIVLCGSGNSASKHVSLPLF